MPRLTVFSSVFAAGVIAAMTVAPARATDTFTYDKLTYMTFSGSVQIPSATLPPGTYRFRLANPSTGRDVLQVLSDDGSIVYSMFHTIPDIRATVTDEPTVTFREMPAGVPPAVRSLFYGGERRGYEFIYPKDGPLMVAKAWPQPDVTYIPTEPGAPDTANASAEPPEPDRSAALEPSGGFEPQGGSGATGTTGQEPATLPNTASPLPFVALGGLTSLVLGLGARMARRRSS